MPNRVAEGFIRLFGEKLGISRNFSYKTIERGYDPQRSKKLLDQVFEIINRSGNYSERVFSVDGTGDPTSMKINYETKRRIQRAEKNKQKDSDAFPYTKGKHDFQYDVLSGGVHTKIIGGFVTTDDHTVGELSHFTDVIMMNLEQCSEISTMLGDALYGNRKACSIVSDLGIKPYFMPKSNATFRAKGVASWSEMMYSLAKDPQTWLFNYHMRSISETINSMIKRKMPWKIRKKLPNRKRTEETLKINIHNLRQYCYLRYTNPKLVLDYKESCQK